MKGSLHPLLLSLFLLFALGSAPSSALDRSETAEGWSQTTPAINLTHVFKGQINRKGKPVGFHHRPQGTDTATAKLSKLLSGPNKAGVYTALVKILDKSSQVWKEKFSSLFPDRLSKLQVVKVILNAYRNNLLNSNRKWRGPSGLGFEIEGYILKDGRIITAYPLYKDRQ